MPLDLATISSRIRVNPDVAGDQTGARMYVSPSDDLLITWNGNHAIAFDASGAALPTPAGTWTGAENWLGDTGLIGQTYGSWFGAVYDGATAVAGPDHIEPLLSSSFVPIFVDALPNGDFVFAAVGGGHNTYLVRTNAALDILSWGIFTPPAGASNTTPFRMDVLPDGMIIAQFNGHLGLYDPTDNGQIASSVDILAEAFTVLDDGGFLALAGTHSRFYNADGTARTPEFTATKPGTNPGIANFGDVVQLDDRLSVGIWYDNQLDETRGVLIEAHGRLLGTGFSLGAGERHDFAALDADTLVSIESSTDSGPGGAGLDIVKSEFTIDRSKIELGTAANDTFSHAGAQLMAGFEGNDWYIVNDVDDYVSEVVGEGTADRIFTSIDYVLRADQEIEILTPDLYAGTTALSLTGNAFAQTIYGNDGANNLTGGGGGDTIFGLGGNDSIFISSANDVVREAAGGGSDRVVSSVSWVMTAGQQIEKLQTSSNLGATNINFTGNEFFQAIYGNRGVNILDGGGGGDTLAGLDGNDAYYVHDSRDNVVELVGEGNNDRVFASVSWQVRAGMEVEEISAETPGSTAAINLTGNEFDQRITGNAGANILIGGGGLDVLTGLGGGDTYYISDSRTILAEQAGGGHDRVFTSVSFSISGQYIEEIATTNAAGTAAINLTGNGIAQTITGNAGANILDGGGAADVLAGLKGDDSYYVDTIGDQVHELAGEGSDRVFASADYMLTAGQSIEKLTTTNNGGLGGIDLTGNGLSQTIYGNAGDNVLNGGGGKDVLIGLDGDDSFLFDTALNTAFTSSFASLAATANVARIDGMTVDDHIALDGSLFGLTPGALSQGAFALGTTATEADDRVLWDAASGAILFDADGAGGAAAQLMAYISNPFNLDYTFFEVV